MCHFLQKSLLMCFSGFIFPWEVAGGLKKIKIMCVVPFSPVFQGRKRDVPQNIISAKNTCGWNKVLLCLPWWSGMGIREASGSLVARLKFSVPLP